ncbi:hypothetical protein K3152_00115 [Qipengyuania sp. 1NDH17]|uniref:Tetratricopeptide repeat protein n=1 Tax=Qipengyuania polymorpha TaxID=2867234 RepID=A0ABS7IX58_9SPHN|nr:hypothetical protein [Qipengyuania polymorpha]MBX7456640.1 hypothetical protein [Qipengyuania polymorpha]
MTAAAQQALALDARDPFVRTTHGRTRYLLGDFAQAQVDFENAIERAPSYAQAFAALGGLHALGGDVGIGIAHNRTALALSPLDPNRDSVFGALICAHLRSGDYQAAADWADRARSPKRTPLQVYGASLAAYFHAGRDEDAEEIAARIRALAPGRSAEEMVSTVPIMTETLKDILREGFRAKGF